MTDTLPTDADIATGTHSLRAGRGLSWPRILRSEWINFTTTRSTVITLTAAGIMMAVVGLIASATATGSVESSGPGGGPGANSTDALGTVLAGQTLMVLVVSIVGVIVGARDYGTSLVRTTYAAVPHRWRVLCGRVGVFIAVSGVVLAVGVFVAFFAGNAILDSGGQESVAITDAGALRAVIGTVGYLVGAGVIGIALGTLTRSTGLGVGTVVGLFLVLPGLGSLLLPDSWSDALDVLPSQAAASFTSLDAGEDYLSMPVGLVVFLVWVVGAVASALISNERRDV